MLYFRSEINSQRIFDIKKIIDFEIKELGNLDIPSYLDIRFDSDVDQRFFNEAMTIDDLSENMVKEMFEKIHKKIEGYHYAIWLTDNLDFARKMYGNSEYDEVSVYDIPDDTFVLSNLGRDGKLFAFKEKVEPIEVKVYEGGILIE